MLLTNTFVNYLQYTTTQVLNDPSDTPLRAGLSAVGNSEVRT